MERRRRKRTSILMTIFTIDGMIISEKSLTKMIENELHKEISLGQIAKNIFPMNREAINWVYENLNMEITIKE